MYENVQRNIFVTNKNGKLLKYLSSAEQINYGVFTHRKAIQQ